MQPPAVLRRRAKSRRLGFVYPDAKTAAGFSHGRGLRVVALPLGQPIDRY
jgi:hypothetical protein